MKKKAGKVVILVLVGIPIVLISCATVAILGIIAKFSSQLPDPDFETIKLIEKPYLCKLAEEKDYSTIITDYDSNFPNHKGIDIPKFSDNLNQCIRNKDLRPTPYTIQEIISYDRLGLENDTNQSCTYQLLRISVFSLRLAQKYTNQETENFFKNHVKTCERGYTEFYADYLMSVDELISIENQDMTYRLGDQCQFSFALTEEDLNGIINFVVDNYEVGPVEYAAFITSNAHIDNNVYLVDDELFGCKLQSLLESHNKELEKSCGLRFTIDDVCQ